MVDSGLGRTERARGRARAAGARRRPEAQHRDVREPRPCFRLVHPDALQALLEMRVPAAPPAPPRPRGRASRRCASPGSAGAEERSARRQANRLSSASATGPTSVAGRCPRKASVMWRLRGSTRRASQRREERCHSSSRSRTLVGKREAAEETQTFTAATVAADVTRDRAGSVTRDAGRDGARPPPRGGESTPGRPGS